jgi:hypothetical protein
LTYFFERSRLVSDSEMQSLWGKLLAGEANSPGSFARRTVDSVSSLEKTDAQLFTNLCTLGWMIGPLTPLVYELDAVGFQKEGTQGFQNLSPLTCPLD